MSKDHPLPETLPSTTDDTDVLLARLALDSVRSDMGEVPDDEDFSQPQASSSSTTAKSSQKVAIISNPSAATTSTTSTAATTGDDKRDQKALKKYNSVPETIKRVFTSLVAPPGERKLTKTERNEIIKSVAVGPLPQRFLVKFIGSKPCDGLWGSKFTRGPIDLLVRELREMDKNDDLPLINVKIQNEGFKVGLHPKSHSTIKVPDVGLMPLQFISYATQDRRYSKVFAFILVREMSSRKRMTECHAYLCDSIVSCRKMSLSVAQAFAELEKTVKDKPHKFQVDLNAVVDDNTEI